MTFLNSANLELVFGKESASSFREIINLIRSVTEKDGLNVSDAVEKLLKDSSIKGARKLLLERLKDWVRENGSPALADLFEPLHVIETRKDASKRKLGWPDKSWAAPDKITGLAKPLDFKLNAEGGAYFEVMEEGNETRAELPGAATYPAVSALTLEGSVKAGLDGKATIGIAGVKGGMKGSFGRSISYSFGHENQSELAGLALASAMGMVRSPTAPEALVQSFGNNGRAELLEVKMKGNEGLGGSLGITAEFPTAYGKPGIELKGEASLSRKFEFRVQEYSEPGKSGLRILADTHRETSNGLEIGVSYVVGLSTLLPKQAEDLLRGLTDLHDKVVKLDEKIERATGVVKTWLKPGDVIKSKIDDHLKLFFKNFDDKPKRPIALFARALGLTDNPDVKVEDVLDDVSEQTGSLIADILDEIPEIFELDEEEIAGRVREVFVDAIDPKVLEFLNTEVLEKMKGEIDSALETTANALNTTAQKAIKKAFGKNGEDIVDAARNLATKARNTVKKILDEVSKAQTELLAAEIGWYRSTENKQAITYSANFDFSEAEAIDTFASVMRRPSRFASLVLSDEKQPSGVMAEKIALTKNLTVKTGHKWSVAFLGLAISGSEDATARVDVKQTQGGVIISANGALEKKFGWFGEMRTVSFLSAMNLFEARMKPVTGNSGGGQKKANASPAIELKFDEADGGLKAVEAEYLLERFEKQGILSSTVSRAVISDVEQAIAAAGTDKIKASISIGLAVPASKVIDLLENVYQIKTGRMGLASNTDPVLEAVLTALAETDPEGIKELVVDDEATTSEDLSADLDVDLDTIEGRVEFLSEAAAMTLSKNTFGVSHVQKKYRKKHHKNQRAQQKQKDYLKPAEHLTIMLQEAASIYFGEHEFLDENSTEAVERKIGQWQNRMNRRASKFLKTGQPAPSQFEGLWKGRVPVKTVALFRALQYLTHTFTEVRPPLMVSFKPKEGAAKSYFSLAETDQTDA